MNRFTHISKTSPSLPSTSPRLVGTKEDGSSLTLSAGHLFFHDKFVTEISFAGKAVPIFQRGIGDYPLLLPGLATMYQRFGWLPRGFFQRFTVYFLDLFDISDPKFNPKARDVSKLKISDFVEVVEQARKSLGLKAIGVFGHSAFGALALEYGQRYPENTLFLIVAATPANWTSSKDGVIEKFFSANSTPSRQKLFADDQKKLAAIKPPFPFFTGYDAKRALVFAKPESALWANIGQGLNLDEALLAHFLGVLMLNTDFRDGKRKLELKKEEVPVFVGLGVQDFIAPFFEWTDDSKNFMKEKNIDYSLFSQSAHFPFMEEEDQFMDKIENFLTLLVTSSKRFKAKL